jgi:hypothetical protein
MPQPNLVAGGPHASWLDYRQAVGDGSTQLWMNGTCLLQRFSRLLPVDVSRENDSAESMQVTLGPVDAGWRHPAIAKHMVLPRLRRPREDHGSARSHGARRSILEAQRARMPEPRV